MDHDVSLVTNGAAATQEIPPNFMHLKVNRRYINCVSYCDFPVFTTTSPEEENKHLMWCVLWRRGSPNKYRWRNEKCIWFSSLPRSQV